MHFRLDFTTLCSPKTLLILFHISGWPIAERNPNQKIQILVQVCILNTHRRMQALLLLRGVTHPSADEISLPLWYFQPQSQSFVTWKVCSSWPLSTSWIAAEWTNTSRRDQPQLPLKFYYCGLFVNFSILLSATSTVEFDYSTCWVQSYYLYSEL